MVKVPPSPQAWSAPGAGNCATWLRQAPKLRHLSPVLSPARPGLPVSKSVLAPMICSLDEWLVYIRGPEGGWIGSASVLSSE